MTCHKLSPRCHVYYRPEGSRCRVEIKDPETGIYSVRWFPSERDARRHISNALDICQAARPASVWSVVATALFWGVAAALIMVAWAGILAIPGGLGIALLLLVAR